MPLDASRGLVNKWSLPVFDVIEASKDSMESSFFFSAGFITGFTSGTTPKLDVEYTWILWQGENIIILLFPCHLLVGSLISGRGGMGLKGLF